jgi:hypothetical protein
MRATGLYTIQNYEGLSWWSLKTGDTVRVQIQMISSYHVHSNLNKCHSISYSRIWVIFPDKRSGIHIHWYMANKKKGSNKAATTEAPTECSNASRKACLRVWWQASKHTKMSTKSNCSLHLNAWINSTKARLRLHFENGCLLGCCIVQSGRRLPMFQRFLLPPSSWRWVIALMMEATSTSETSVNFYQTTRHNSPEDSHLHTRRRENLKPHKTSLRAVPDL